MHQLLDNTKDNVIAVRLTGQVDKATYDELIPIFEKKIGRHGKISAYLELELLESMSPAALWQEVKFDINHAQHLDRVALVGDQGWLDWVASAAKPFTSAEIRHFPVSERDAAWFWVQGEKAPDQPPVRG